MRLKPKVRQAMILTAAVSLARQPGGWASLTRTRIAKQANCAEGLVSKYLGDMTNVRRAVMRVAISRSYASIIAQGIATGHPLCLKLSPNAKRKALIDLGE